jgi:peptidoglycan/LPS O-acetylase OafA/YrhL
MTRGGLDALMDCVALPLLLDLFFILSGFVMAHVYGRGWRRAGENNGLRSQ